MPNRAALTPITRLAAARGMRHGWLAQRIGVSHSMFNHIEAGRRTAPADYYEKAALILGASVEDLDPKLIRRKEAVA